MADGLVTIAVELQDGSVVKGVADMKSAFGSFTGETDKASGSMTKFGVGAGVATALAQKGIQLITATVGDAVKRVDTLNNSNRAFQNMGVSAKDVKKNMSLLNDSINGLPTSLDSAVSGVQLLTSSTGDMGQSTKVFAAMNDAILGFGGSSEQVQNAVTQLSQAFSNGKVDAETWNSMIDSGMGPALNALAKQMGITSGELKSGLSDGSISVKQFQDALIDLDKNGGGGLQSLQKIAQDSTAGISTSAANLRTAFVRNLANVIGAFQPVIVSALGAVTSFVNTFGSILTPIVKAIGDGFKAVMDFLSPILPALKALAGGAATMLVLAAGFVAISSAAAAASKFITGTEGAMALLANPLTAVAALLIAFGSLLISTYNKSEPFRNAINNLVKTLRDAFVPVVNAVKDVLSAVAGIFGITGNAAEKAGGGVKKTSDIFTVLGNVLTPVINWITKLGQAFANWLVPEIAAVQTPIVQFATSVKNMVSSFAPLIKSVQDVITVFNPFASLLDKNNALQTEAGVTAMHLKAQLADMFGPVLSMIQPVVAKVKEFASSMMSAGNANGGVAGLLLTIGGFVSPLVTVAKLAVQFFQAFQDTGSITGAIGKMGDNFVNLAVNIVNSITAVLPTLISVGTDILTAIMNGITQALPTIVNAAISILNGLVTAIINALPTLLGAAQMIITSLVNALTLLLPTLITIGLQIILTLVNALVQNLPQLISAAITLIQALLNGMLAMLPALIEAGITIILALVEGLIDMLPELLQAAIQLITALLGALIAMLPQLISAGMQLLEGLINGLIQVMPQLIQAGIQLITALFQALISMTPQILSAGIQLIQALIRGVGQLLGSLMQAGGQLIGGMLSAILGYLGQLLSAGGQLVSSLISGIGSRIGGVASSVSNGISSAVSAVTGFVGSMTSAAGNLVDGLINGITGKISGVVNAAKKMAKSAVDAAKDFLNIHSPSRVMRDEVGKFIPEGLAIGIDRYANVAVDSMNELSSKLTNIKPEPQISWGTAGGMNAASAIIQHQVVGNGTAVQPQEGNTAYIEMNTTVQANPSEAEQARQLKNTMRQMGYDATW